MRLIPIVGAMTALGISSWLLVRRWRARKDFGGLRLKEQAPGVLYDTVAREWRCKVASRDHLGSAQAVWEDYRNAVARVPGVVRVQRLCCGTCLDFRILVTMRAHAYPRWRNCDHEPEAAFLGALQTSPGITDVRSQMLSIMVQ